MKKTLRLDSRGSYDYHGAVEHPQTTMKKLEISYEKSDPCPIADCWLFYGCTNVPDVLPNYIDDITLPNKIEVTFNGIQLEVVNFLGSDEINF